MTGERPLVVTGAAGHLGSVVAGSALAMGLRTIALVRREEVADVPEGCETIALDWADVSALTAAFESVGQCDIIHCAGLGVRAGAGAHGTALLYDANVGTVWRLLSSLRDGFAGTVLLVSSAAVYGAHPAVPTPEDAALDPSRHYAASKVAAEAVGAAFNAASGVSTVIARPFNIIGTREPPDSVLGVIAGQLDAASGPDVAIRVREDTSVRDFIDIRDVADALLVLVDRGQPGGVYNVCTGVGTDIASLIAAAGHAWGLTASSVATAIHADPSTSVGDPSRLRGLGWNSRYSLGDSLAALRSARAAGRGAL